MTYINFSLNYMNMADLLSHFITGEDVFKYIEGMFVRAIEGEIQSDAVAVNVQFLYF